MLVCMTAQSPPITNDGWGLLEVGTDTYKDAKLWPGGSRGWDWNESGTAHRPGVTAADVEELVAAGAAVIILSTGRGGRLEVPAATTELLRERDVEVEVLPTDEAIVRYNRLAGEGVAVAALIHSTC